MGMEFQNFHIETQLGTHTQHQEPRRNQDEKERNQIIVAINPSLEILLEVSNKNGPKISNKDWCHGLHVLKVTSNQTNFFTSIQT